MERVFPATSEGEQLAESPVDALIAQHPSLRREGEYLELLRRTGGFIAYHEESKRTFWSFTIYGFGDMGHRIPTLTTSELFDDGFFCFGDLMQESFDEPLVFAFKLRGDDRRIFAAPEHEKNYSEYAADFVALITAIIEGPFPEQFDEEISAPAKK